ncbi:multifunctional hydroxymethylpyrimidine phosphokinase/4-amino-5-aminomethyl-2-methylpyrimidine hydrolase [Kingella potus]|uniref:Aminopyrimidine aminohydrolase n=1 Tax=Kingella potus TaxID=265175 RepID=A0A377R3M2_9NEIS|nr:TenA family protein [Kingella potus]UOP00093.1 TenA family protein [Kingella potus]STR03387.1 multifunctional hydroxymethylpyrimidine phosphokinase/4-amino-5-aminomethyl-2-methylpyrimidine hydrolase [Kingella potus]
MTSDFSDILHSETAALWQAATRHRFTEEIFAGTLSDAHLRRYLVQDYQFIDRFTALLGAAIAAADHYPARVRLSQFAAMITGDENTYFQRCFDYLGVPEAERTAPALLPVTRQFQELMREAADTRSYVCALAVLCVAEGLYLDWADRPDSPLPQSGFRHAEWITLHANPFFRGFVAWLRAELARTGAAASETERQQARSLFHRAVSLECAFFDAVYED